MKSKCIKKEQLYNIIGFTFNLHQELGINWRRETPEYFIEKWESYIGHIPLDDREFEMNSYVDEWISTWNVDVGTYRRIRHIIHIISIINSRSLLNQELRPVLIWTLCDIIDEYSNIIDISSINDRLHNGLHPIVKQEINKWLEIPCNKREFSLTLIL
jgi:hypothetical protein